MKKLTPAQELTERIRDLAVAVRAEQLAQGLEAAHTSSGAEIKDVVIQQLRHDVEIWRSKNSEYPAAAGGSERR
jgi:hypothetical protein